MAIFYNLEDLYLLIFNVEQNVIYYINMTIPTTFKISKDEPCIKSYAFNIPFYISIPVELGWRSTSRSY